MDVLMDAPGVRRLKTWRRYFQALESGRKTFEIRCGHFEEGMTIICEEWDQYEEEYTGKALVFRVTYALKIAENSHGLCLPFPLSDEPAWVLGLKQI